MARALTLRDDTGARLELEADAAGWCTCWLAQGSGRRRLGAESLPHLVERLLAGLAGEGSAAAGQLEGIPVRFILSLAEEHFTVYAATEGMPRAWFVQGPAGDVVARLELSAERAASWVESLRALGAEAPRPGGVS